MKLIDKDAVEAELKRRVETIRKAFNDPSILSVVDRTYGVDRTYANAQSDAFKSLLTFLDTLEVKEVDLENLFQALPEKIADEKSHQVYELSIYHYDGQCVVDYVGEIDHNSLYTFDGNTLYEAIEKAWNWLHKNSTGG